ncbi:MAG: patatin-like phospholipase family protein [Pseudomonadota bacterium]
MKTKTVTLGLQGGGAHGAFTWGVLDRLLDDPRISFEAISGASAGAMNAVALAHGYTVGGRDGARQALKDFWQSVSSKASLNFMQGDANGLSQNGTLSTPLPSFVAALSMVKFFSPYQLNPFDINPLRDILTSQIDFERLRSHCKIKLFIATTRISSGTLKLFRNKKLSVEVLLASACLPSVHHAVDIDGEAFWDGGLTANPPLFPLLHKCTARDVIVVLLQPHPRLETPTSAEHIAQRLTEMGFSSTFFTELQGLALAKHEAERSYFAFGRLERRLRRLNMHMIESPDLMSQLGQHSKLNSQPAFINALFDAGKASADSWLETNFKNIGFTSSYNMSKLLN